MRRTVLALLLLLGCSRPVLAAWTNLPDINTPVCVAAGDQYPPAAISDGAGGTIVTWRDSRSGNFDVYGQRFDAQGNALWTANGVALCTQASFQDTPALCSDGAGGAILVWRDDRSGSADLYAQRVNAAGTPLWTANGVPVFTGSGSQDAPVVLADGANGAFVCWRDTRSGNFDVYAQRLGPSGSLLWNSAGVGVATSALDQYGPFLCTDGQGGFFVTWTDGRAGTYDPYVQRFNSAGVAQWPANGLLLCGAADWQYPTGIATDGTGTAVIVWTDQRTYASTNLDVYVGAVSATGGLLWGSNGIAVCANSSQQREPSIASDNAGGFYVVWNDTRSGVSNDMYGQHLGPGGNPLWTADGLALVSGTYLRDNPQALPDGTGGLLMYWQDQRGNALDIYAGRFNSSGTAQWTAGGVGLFTNVVNANFFTAIPQPDGGLVAVTSESRLGHYDVFAQRVDHYGFLGWTSPTITSIKDVPSDQGGKVKLSFTAPYFEDEPYFGVSSYRIYRSVGAAALASRLARARVSEDPDAVAASPGDVLYHTASATADYYWELLTTVAVDYLDNYSVLAATAYDSTSLGNPRTAFMVQARNSTKHWDSPPDSGYSVDNLAPLAPVPFTGQYTGGAVTLHWNPNGEADLAGYRLYRGTTPGFATDGAHLVSAQPDTGYAGAASGPAYYKLTAVDAHGNESPPTPLLPAGTLAVGEDARPARNAFTALGPNPARGPVQLAWALREPANVSFEVVDLSGRVVARFQPGARDAGAWSAAWTPADGSGQRLRAGVYLVRMHDGARTVAVRKLALLP